MPFKKEYLTEKDIEMLGLCSASTLRNERWRGESRIPYYKIGRSVRYKREDVLAYMKKSEYKKMISNIKSEAKKKTKDQKLAQMSLDELKESIKKSEEKFFKLFEKLKAQNK
jgi:hypothetical protein